MNQKKILVVDDEKDLVEAIKLELEENQFHVLTAFDGLEGLEKARQESPDLMILDLMLPKMDGHKVCGLLKRDARTSKTPILMLTARAHEDDRRLAQEVGADAYITKPFEPKTLLAKVKELTTNGSGRSTSEFKD